ncbi:hypothetical protein [Methylobacterium radiodurans]|uniref:DUF308 domain-containing protein n=1 Tax=Methylobacterium radiodurans TaxID=2202828 RepID=A0A2U8VP68_9HYPH|nr:hypothetical protein [Methylobacterium radiodurans]AWN35405.1 hypothetical protein DK427_06400 [Methylobacterium radiodurans]
MIVALFALAAAMVIGGSAAVIQGFPFVRLESGLAMVIAGSVTASAGAVLAGLGVVVVYLRRVERGLRNRPVPVPTALPPFPEMPRAEAPAPRPVLPAALGGAAGLGGAALAAGGRRQAEPTFEDTLFEPAPPEPAREPELPMPGLSPKPPQPAEETAETPAHDASVLPRPAAEAPHPAEPAERDATRPHAEPDDGVGPEDDLFARPDATEPERPELRPSLDAVEEPAAPLQQEPPAPEPLVAPEPPREATRKEVVGKYASGGNTYVMFADGSIEAETPQGRFTFASLDELKAFVDAGGERSARGAA